MGTVPAAATGRPDPPPPAELPEVAEFAAAMAEYRRLSGRNFPTWTEVLEVLRQLGYAKPADRG